MDLEMVSPTQTKIDEQRCRGAAMLSRLPLQLQLPDLIAPKQPRPQPIWGTVTVTTGSPASESAATAAGESGRVETVAAARTEISQRRYEEGHRQVTRIIDRMRDRRRRWFDRLWFTSVLLTVLSIGALAIELYQNFSEPQSDADTAATYDAMRPTNLQARKSEKRTGKQVVPINSEDPANEMAEPADDETPVNSAIYTTTEGGQPQGAWLTGKINDGEENSLPEEADQPSETANQ
jgi:hypothetical protein